MLDLIARGHGPVLSLGLPGMGMKRAGFDHLFRPFG